MRNNQNLHLILIFLCLFFSIPARAAGEELSSLDEEKLYGVFEKFIVADSPFPAEDLEISNFSSRPETVKLPPGQIEYLYDMGPMTGRLGLRSFNLKVLVDGKLVEKIKMSGNVQLYGTILSAARVLKRGSLISAGDLITTRRNISSLGSDLAKDPSQVVGKQLKTTLQPGNILFTSLLKAPEIIKRGDMVVILAESGPIHVSVPGKARSAGALGDMIKVKNMMSRREIYAKIINQDEVQVEF